jgi:hypothetical protein
MTPSFFTSAAAPMEGVELKARHCCLAALRATCRDTAVNMVKGFQNIVGEKIENANM